MAAIIPPPLTFSIPTPPTIFALMAFGDRWYHWREIKACFWPGRGQRSRDKDPTLADVRFIGGVYLMAWSEAPPKLLHPTASEVKEIGETGEYCRRMRQFGDSAGFFGKRRRAHSTAEKWPLGRSEKLWVAFFPTGDDFLPNKHLSKAWRCWLEGVAFEEHLQVHGSLPALNAAKAADGEIHLD
jgi:hypothetical protein